MTLRDGRRSLRGFGLGCACRSSSQATAERAGDFYGKQSQGLNRRRSEWEVHARVGHCGAGSVNYTPSALERRARERRSVPCSQQAVACRAGVGNAPGKSASDGPRSAFSFASQSAPCKREAERRYARPPCSPWLSECLRFTRYRPLLVRSRPGGGARRPCFLPFRTMTRWRLH